MKLIDYQLSYQKTGYQEEYVDADKATARCMQPGMECHDGQYRYGPQTIDIRPMPATGIY